MAQGDPCALCELPRPRREILRVFDGRELGFCCMGCANVYAILLESGVVASGEDIRQSEVFRRSLELGLISNPASEPEPRKKSPAAVDPNLPTQEALYQVGGMWCSACGWLIEHALGKLPGVVSAEVYFASDLAKVTYSPIALPPARIPERIRQLGYKVEEYQGEHERRPELRDLLMRLGVAAFLWANIMSFSVILYVGYFEQISASMRTALPWVLMTLTTPMIFYCAWPILRSAWMGARNLQVRMETLLALGILSAYLFSIAQSVRGEIHLYFDTAAAIVTLVLAGKLIERAAKDRAARSISMLYRVMPKKARVQSPAGERFVAIEALEPGQIFLVKAGERVPADGVVVAGSTEMDESLLTGESRPIAKTPGDTIVSGSLNAGGPVSARALRTSQESALSQIIRLVERALSSRAAIERTVDRASRVFVPSVVAVALVTFAAMMAMHAGPGAALMRAISILVIACPCALGLATPLAITAAVGSASRAGLLIADAQVLETMGRIDTVVLDKTGTVTEGDFRMVEHALVPTLAPDPETFQSEWLPLLSGVERWSEHLLGRAILRAAYDAGVAPAPVEQAEVVKGQGIAAAHEGRRLFIGNRALLSTLGCPLPAEAAEIAANWEQAGHTVAFFGQGQSLAGMLAFGDQIKPGAPEMVEALGRRGIEVQLLSGDARATTEVVARAMGVKVFTAEATPEQKAGITAGLQQKGRRVAVIGDGVNDAPALAQADLGLALGTGAEIAMGAAPVVLVSGALGKVEEAFRLGEKTTRIVRQNLFWAFFYNMVGLTLAVSGTVSPIVAAAAMLFSSISVVGNSMRLMNLTPGQTN